MAPYGTNWAVKWFVSGKTKAAATSEAAKADVSQARKSTSSAAGNATRLANFPMVEFKLIDSASAATNEIDHVGAGTSNAAGTAVNNTEHDAEPATNTIADKVKQVGRPCIRSHDSG